MIHVEIPTGLLGQDFDLGEIAITREMIAAYVRAVGDVHADVTAPPTYCLVLRRGMTPEIELPRETFGVYGGHDLEFHQPLRADQTYRVSGRVVDVYEKSGRGGPMTVVVREAAIQQAGGQLAVRIVERQIVRRIPREGSASVVSHAALIQGSALPQAFEPSLPPGPINNQVAPGDELGPWRRSTPSSEGVAAYVRSARMREGLFLDADHARALGYRGIVVPGPMLAAFLEQFLRAQLPGWRIGRLSTTFRVPTISGDALLFHGAVTEHHTMADGERVVCDVIIEHASGDRAVTGTATLRRIASI